MDLLPSESTVLICGGGPVGLTEAIMLRHLNIDCVLIEKISSTLGLPKGTCHQPTLARNLAPDRSGYYLPTQSWH